MLYVSYYDSPIGEITLGAREDVLVGAWFEGQKYYMDKIIEDFEEKKDLPVLDQAEYWLDRYFAGQDPDPDPALQNTDPASTLPDPVPASLSSPQNLL